MVRVRAPGNVGAFSLSGTFFVMNNASLATQGATQRLGWEQARGPCRGDPGVGAPASLPPSSWPSLPFLSPSKQGPEFHILYLITTLQDG